MLGLFSFSSRRAAIASSIVAIVALIAVVIHIHDDTNAYSILGLNKGDNPTSSDIKKAFKKQSLKYHPDKNRSEDAKDVFLQLQQAYEVLNKGSKRDLYEKYGHGWPQDSTNAERKTDDDIRSEFTVYGVLYYIALALTIYFASASAMLRNVLVGILGVCMYYDISAAASSGLDPDFQFDIPWFLTHKTQYQLAWLARGVLTYVSIAAIILHRINRRKPEAVAADSSTNGNAAGSNSELAKEVKALREEVKKLKTLVQEQHEELLAVLISEEEEPRRATRKRRS